MGSNRSDSEEEKEIISETGVSACGMQTEIFLIPGLLGEES